MALPAQQPEPGPEDTARVARAAFPEGHRSVRLREALDTIDDEALVAPLLPPRGQPAAAPWRLAVVTRFPLAAGLADRQAADAVRSRSDWKDALSRELRDPGGDHPVRSEFRRRRLTGRAEHLRREVLLERLPAPRLRKARGRPRPDSPHVRARGRALTRVERVGETMRQALTTRAGVAPDGRRADAQPEGGQRSDRRAAEDRLPTKQERRQARAQRLGADGAAWLTAVDAAGAPSGLRAVPAVELFRRGWVQNDGPRAAEVRWRPDEAGIPASADFRSSPDDAAAPSARKRTTAGGGDTVPRTATGDDARPQLMTQVETTAAPVAAGAVTPVVHHARHEQRLLPATPSVATGDRDAALLVTSRQEYDVDSLGPARAPVTGQAPAGQGVDAQSCGSDWEPHRATCPQGQSSIRWTPAVENRPPHVITIKFATTACGTGPCRTPCLRAQKRDGRRTLTVRPKDHYRALKARRARANAGIRGRLGPPCGDRGHPLPRRPRPAVAAHTLLRPGEDPPESRVDRGRNHSLARRRRAGRNAPRQDPAVPLHRAHDAAHRCLIQFATSIKREEEPIR